MTRRRKKAEDMTQQAETTALTWKQGDRCRVFLNGTTYEGLVLSARGRNTEKQCQWVQVQLSRTVPGLDGQPCTQTWVHPQSLPTTRLGQPGEQQPGPQAEAPYLCVTKKIKLEISEQDAATLEFMQGKCRGLYNWWIMELRSGEKWPGWEEAKKTLQASKEYDPELCGVYSKLLQEVYFRLDRAMKAFFRRVKNGEKPGFPRVRPRHCFFALCYPAMYVTIKGNKLTLPTGGGGKHGPKHFPDIVATLTEEAPTKYGTVAITRDGRGDYYASFVHEVKETSCESESVLAIDLGIKTLATGINEQGRVYQIGGFKGSRWYNKQLDKIRSKRDRCKKGSRRYKHLSQVYKRVSQKKRNKQQDCLHKASHLIAHKTVERTIVLGDLSQRQMVTKQHNERNKHLNRAVFNDWGLYTFVQMLTYKCVLAGKVLVILDERETTRTCCQCGHKQHMPLWQRTYRCKNPKCCLVIDRDVNSAINILKRFFARLGPHTERISVRCADVFTAIEHQCAEAFTATDNGVEYI